MQAPCEEEVRTSPPPAGGDAPAFEEAYLRFAPLLRKIAIRKFHIPRPDAETLVHDIFATYLMHASSVRNLEPYLIGAICNASRHYLRRRDASEALFCGETPCMAAPDDELLREVDRKLLLSRVLSRIGTRCRDLLRRYYLRGETTQSIADALDSTPGSVLVTLHNCRKRARAAVDALEGGR